MKAAEFDRLTTLEKCQAVCIGVMTETFNRSARVWFGIRHPILETYWCWIDKPETEIKKGLTVRVVSREIREDLYTTYYYAAVQHKDQPNKFMVTRIYNPMTKEESLGLEADIDNFFANPLALPGYKPNRFREITAKPHKQEEKVDPRYGTYTSTNR
jgi:hypothetical protein